MNLGSTVTTAYAGIVQVDLVAFFISVGIIKKSRQ